MPCANAATSSMPAIQRASRYCPSQRGRRWAVEPPGGLGPPGLTPASGRPLSESGREAAVFGSACARAMDDPLGSDRAWSARWRNSAFAGSVDLNGHPIGRGARINLVVVTQNQLTEVAAEPSSLRSNTAVQNDRVVVAVGNGASIAFESAEPPVVHEVRIGHPLRGEAWVQVVTHSAVVSQDGPRLRRVRLNGRQ